MWIVHRKEIRKLTLTIHIINPVDKTKLSSSLTNLDLIIHRLRDRGTAVAVVYVTST